MALWVEFRRAFDAFPKRRCILSFKAGERRLVPRAIASQAIVAGAAIRIERPEGAHVTKSGRTVLAHL